MSNRKKMRMNSFRFYKNIRFFLLAAVAAALVSCNIYQKDGETIITGTSVDGSATDNFMILPQEDPYMLRTTFRANDLDLETPLRCNVNWKTQEMVQILPHNNISFKIEKNGIDDPLPDLEIRDFSFDNIPAEQALLKLTEEAEMTLVAKDAP